MIRIDFLLLGVNIDLVDAGGSIVASDDFTGLLGDFATSAFIASNLSPGRLYRLVLRSSAQCIASNVVTATPSNGP